MIRRTQNLIASALASFALTGAVAAVATPVAAAQSPSAGALLSIPVHAPGGGQIRLVYAPGNGWRALAGNGGERPTHQSAVRKAAATEPATDPDTTTAAEDPLSVFVDGPTGYVFVWTADKPGWTFAGHVGEGRP